MKTELSFVVEGQSLSRTDNNKILGNTNNVYVCHFDVPVEWADLILGATFKRDRFTYNVLLDEENNCGVPTEILKDYNNTSFEVALYGIDNDTTTTTTICEIPVIQGTPFFSASAKITPSIYEQIMHKISEIAHAQVSPEIVSEVVKQYLVEHPIEGVTEESAQQIVFDYVTAHKAELKGEQGVKGDKGDNGDNGKSAYQIAVDNGYSGNEQEWLASLKGKDATITDAQIYAAVERYFNEHETPTPTKTLSSISASKTKTSYNVGETLDTSDIVVTASYSDSTTANVTSISTISTSDVDMSAIGNYNIEISYTENNVTKTATIAITVSVVNVVDVGIGNNYTYHSIKDAENAVQDGGTIRIHEGTYDEYALGTSSKAITYEGVDKDTCIVQNGLSDKMYSVFDLCGGNKTVKNLTIHQTHSDPQNPNTSEVAYKAYSVHCDMESCANHKYVVDNCILKNRYFACCGFGTWQDTEIVVKDCDIDLYDTNRDITGTGAYYCHSNTYADGVTGQRISLVNNTIHADQSLAIRIDSSKKSNSEMICEFIGNTCSSELYGATNDCVRFEQNEYTTLAETSTGNNIPILNYSASADYVAPSGLKDTGYWFVVYDKTQDKYFAGNCNKKIIKGYKTSAQQLAFTMGASSGTINGWTSTDGENWTQVTTNKAIYKASVTTNTNSDTTDKYAFGSNQYNDDIVLIDVWSDSEFSWEY